MYQEATELNKINPGLVVCGFSLWELPFFYLHPLFKVYIYTCELKYLHVCLKNMQWEAELRLFPLSPARRFPSLLLPYFSLARDKRLLEDNAVQIASDIGLISLFLIIFPALPYLCIYAFERSKIQG